MPKGRGSGDRALLLGGRRFFDFAQNDIGGAQDDICLARNDNIALYSGGTFWDTLLVNLAAVAATRE